MAAAPEAGLGSTLVTDEAGQCRGFAVRLVSGSR